MIWNLLNYVNLGRFLVLKSKILLPVSNLSLSPKRMNIVLPDDIYDILVEYYNNAYDSEFVTIVKAATERSGDRIVVRPQVNQFGRIQIRSEIFGSYMLTHKFLTFFRFTDT